MFEQWSSTIPSISQKRTTSSHLKSCNTNRLRHTKYSSCNQCTSVYLWLYIYTMLIIGKFVFRVELLILKIALIINLYPISLEVFEQ